MESSKLVEDNKIKKKKKSKPHKFNIKPITITDWIETIDDEIEWKKEVDFFLEKSKNSLKSLSEDQSQHSTKFQQSGNNNDNSGNISSSSPGNLSQQSQDNIQPIEESNNTKYRRCIDYILDSEESMKNLSAKINLLCLRDNVEAFCGDVPGNGDCFFHAVNVVKTYLESDSNSILKNSKEINAQTLIFKKKLLEYLVTLKQNDSQTYNDSPFHEFYDSMIERLKVKKTIGTMPDNMQVYALIIKEVFDYTVHTICLNEYKNGWLKSFDGIYEMPQVLYKNEKEIFVLLSTIDNSDESAHYYPIFPIRF